MTKDDVKTLAEGDDRLQWWCAVLFGEICELVEANKGYKSPETMFRLVEHKVTEFEAIVRNRAVELAKEGKTATQSLADRVARIEERLGLGGAT